MCMQQQSCVCHYGSWTQDWVLCPCARRGDPEWNSRWEKDHTKSGALRKSFSLPRSPSYYLPMGTRLLTLHILYWPLLCWPPIEGEEFHQYHGANRKLKHSANVLVTRPFFSAWGFTALHFIFKLHNLPMLQVFPCML